jgi:tRNA(fMet)-specific endonuclease VapC
MEDKSMILDTVVLIDLERAIVRGKAAPAMVALKRFADQELFLTPIVAGELAAGESMRNHDVWSRLIEPFTLLTIDSQSCWKYGELYRALRKKGTMIAANDLWIAATALAYNQVLLTRDRGDFNKVPGLRLETY